MAWKLEKTFLSKRPGPGALLTAMLGLMVLMVIHALELNHLRATGELVFQKHEYWRLFTSELLHADLTHLSHNAFSFTGLAFLLNGYFGFWVFPVLTLLVGALVNLITIAFYPPHVGFVGISGVVYFMAAFWLTSFILIERRVSLGKRLIYAIGMALIFFFPETFQPETSYLAHGVGLALGLPAAAGHFWINKKSIRAEERWIYKPETAIDFDWGDPEAQVVATESYLERLH